MRTLFSALFVAALLPGCGQSLTAPQSLPITTYRIGTSQLTFEMTSCSDVCVAYEAADCSAEVDHAAFEIAVDVTVAFSEKSDCGLVGSAAERCGAPVLAHCQVDGLRLGTYKVTANSFSASIDVVN